MSTAQDESELAGPPVAYDDTLVTGIPVAADRDAIGQLLQGGATAGPEDLRLQAEALGIRPPTDHHRWVLEAVPVGPGFRLCWADPDKEHLIGRLEAAAKAAYPQAESIIVTQGHGWDDVVAAICGGPYDEADGSMPWLHADQITAAIAGPGSEAAQ